MRRGLLDLPLLLGAFVACAGAPQTPASPTASTRASTQPIAGAWRLAEHVNWDSSGKPVPQFGPNPVGYFVHDEAGRFSVHIMRTAPVQPSTAAPDGLGYYGSFGTYTVDRERSQCAYRVEGSSRTELVGTEARLPCRVEGDSLIIEDGKTFRRVWRRLP
jgi:hypothetical protein